MKYTVKDWQEQGDQCGFKMPTAPRWKRLPIIRHFRTIKTLIAVERHYSSGFGSIGIRTGYDDWVLWGMWRGLERGT